MKKYTITLGGWYQRTTLHLSEVHGFFESGYSKLPLKKNRLRELFTGLDLTSVERHADFFEYVEAHTSDGIRIRYFEDGLYILSCDSADIPEAKSRLESYFKDNFEPAIAYIFSLGAPTPKLLANIESKHPIVMTVHVDDMKTYRLDEDLFGKAYQTVKTAHSTVYKTQESIVIVTTKEKQNITDQLIASHIFFREFKDQLEKYLHIHRMIWEDISEIKEQRFIQGSEVEDYRAKLDSYQKTIDLIMNRINQMGSYSMTRASIARQHDLEESLSQLFQYRFEVLQDTLFYIKEIWNMTDKYLKAAIQNIIEIKGQSASRNIVSLQVITTAGVVAALYNHLSRPDIPGITSMGVLYFMLLLSITWIINWTVMKFYSHKEYKIGIADRAKM
jgi:hypothetical protein